MGIDISQWRSVIGNFGLNGKKNNDKSRQRHKFKEEIAAQKLIQQEVTGFWKSFIVIVSLLLASWFFIAHSLPGEGISEPNISGSRFCMNEILGGGRPIKVLPQNIFSLSNIQVAETLRTTYNS